MVGCLSDPKSGTDTQAVAAAISADEDLSFFYRLGDIIYTISGSDTEGRSNPIRIRSGATSFSVRIPSSPRRSSRLRAIMMASTRRRSRR